MSVYGTIGPLVATYSAYMYKNEPPRGKTNTVVSEQVQYKPACTVTEKS